MIWKKRARSRTGSALIFRNLLAGTTLFLVTMLGITLALTLRFSISAVQEKIEGNLKSTATWRRVLWFCRPCGTAAAPPA